MYLFNCKSVWKAARTANKRSDEDWLPYTWRTSMKGINRLKGKTLINERVSQKEENMGLRVGWTWGAAGFRTEADEEQGRRAKRKQRGIVLVRQALGDTLKHIHSFTHWHGRPHKRLLLPTATQTRAGISEGQPRLQSSVLGVACRSTRLFFSSPDLWHAASAFLQPCRRTEVDPRGRRSSSRNWSNASKGAATLDRGGKSSRVQ